MLERTPPTETSVASVGPSRKKRKRTLDRTAAPFTIIQEPGADWVPIERALFWYSRSGYIQSAAEWEKQLRAIVTSFIESGRLRDQTMLEMAIAAGIPEEQRCSLGSANMPSELFFEVSKWRQARIEASGWRLGIDGARANITVRGPDTCFGGSPSEFLTKYRAMTYEQRQGAGTWLDVAESIIGHFRRSFLHCLTRGAARIMARKNTVLAPFERVTWDQWTYFQLDEPKWTERERGGNDRFLPPDWFPSYKSRREDNFGTATGPAGEKLYAVHIAPGAASIAGSNGGNDPEDKCLQELLDLMRQFPHRPPQPLPDLAEALCSAFPGLSERGFYGCFALAKQQTGNSSWSKAGRFPNSRRISPHKK
jgi:hypothetical protein